MSVRKLKSHPRIMFVSDNPPSAVNLSSATIFSRGIGSLGSLGRAATSIARGIGAAIRSILFEPGISIVSPIVSLMYTSAFPLGSTGMSTINSLPSAKGMSLLRNCGGGMSFWTEACKFVGSQSSHCTSSFAKSQIVSEITPHSKGQGAPPKVKRSVISAATSSGSCVAVVNAVAKWRMPRR